ncbi:MAG: hypothetical protein Q7S39_04970 [Ignavibacteria bacterium]|nr:hypothetical protein [Ignavibacteria bacterium]
MKNITKTFIVSLMILTVSFSQNINDWQTYFEKSGYLKTPRYEETMEYFDRLANHSEYSDLFTFGVSPQGRNLNCLIVSKDKVFTV